MKQQHLYLITGFPCIYPHSSKDMPLRGMVLDYFDEIIKAIKPSKSVDSREEFIKMNREDRIRWFLHTHNIHTCIISDKKIYKELAECFERCLSSFLSEVGIIPSSFVCGKNICNENKHVLAIKIKELRKSVDLERLSQKFFCSEEYKTFCFKVEEFVKGTFKSVLKKTLYNQLEDVFFKREVNAINSYPLLKLFKEDIEKEKRKAKEKTKSIKDTVKIPLHFLGQRKTIETPGSPIEKNLSLGEAMKECRNKLFSSLVSEDVLNKILEEGFRKIPFERFFRKRVGNTVFVRICEK